MTKDKSMYLNTDFIDSLERFISVKAQQKGGSDFIGHCCLLKEQIPSSPPSPSELSNASIKLPSDNQDPQTSAATSPCYDHDIAPPLSGCIFFPEFDLFIDSPFDSMDIHAVGAKYNVERIKLKKRKKDGTPSFRFKRDEYLPARWHGVIDHEFACRNIDLTPISNGPIPISWKCMYLRNIKIKTPENNSIKKVCLTTFIVVYISNRF